MRSTCYTPAIGNIGCKRFVARFTWLSFVVSSIAFGLLHGRWLAGTVARMAYAAALYRRGRIGEAVYAHMTTDALIAGYVLWSGRWSLWS